MPSPFPGVDPYLESELWTSFHSWFANQVARQLNPLLVPKYVAVTERYYLTGNARDLGIAAKTIIPDIGVRPVQPSAASIAHSNRIVAPVTVETVMPLRVPQLRVAIRDADEKSLVTEIEFLSITDKKGEGRKKYLRKRARILASSSHLLEIDLFRKGRRVPSVEPLPDAPYFVLLGRAEDRPVTDVWPIALDQALPTVPVPLLPEDEDVLLDLQQAFTSCYDEGHFELLIDYTRDPVVPLDKAQAEWGRARIEAFKQ